MTAIRKLLLLLVLLLLAAMSAWAATWETVDPPGSTWAIVTGINSAGDMVGEYQDTAGLFHGFLFRGGLYTDFEVPGSLSTSPFRINDSGEITGVFEDVNGIGHGFLFDGTNYEILDFPKAVGTAPTGVNNAGEVVGFYDDSHGRRHGFTWNNGTFTAVDVPGFRHTHLYGINDRGEIVGFYQYQARYYSFLLTATGTFKKFAFSWLAMDINDHKVVVGYDGAFFGYKYNLKTHKANSYQFPGSKGTSFFGSNDVGQIVGQYYDGFREHGLVRTP